MADAGGARAMAAFSGGVVTFVFTDIEGSTALWERHPSLMAATLERHDNLVSDAVVAEGKEQRGLPSLPVGIDANG